MNAKRIQQEGRIKLSVNGEIIEPLGFMTYHVDGGQFQRMAEIGNRIMFYTICASDWEINTLAAIRPFGPHYFIAPDTYDFSEVDRVMEMIAPNGEGPYIMPRVYLSAPHWWTEKYPEECARSFQGDCLGQCFGSVRWKEDMWQGLKALVDHVNASPWRERVIGYHVCAGSTEEWTPQGSGRMGADDDMDYSEVNRRLFVAWLEKKYGDVNVLNRAWGEDYEDFDQVTFPTPVQRNFTLRGVLREESREQSVMDVERFSCEQMADAICYFNRRLKEYSQDTLLTGTFYGYINCHTNADRCHFALRRVLESPYIDFVCTTNSQSRI